MKIYNKFGMLEEKNGELFPCLIIGIDYVNEFVLYRGENDELPLTICFDNCHVVTADGLVIYDSEITCNLTNDEILIVQHLKQRFDETYFAKRDGRIERENFDYTHERYKEGDQYRCTDTSTDEEILVRTPLLAFIWFINKIDKAFESQYV